VGTPQRSVGEPEREAHPDWATSRANRLGGLNTNSPVRSLGTPQRTASDPVNVPTKATASKSTNELTDASDNWLVRRGHTLSYIGIFLFTFTLYFRPYELIPGLSALSSMALILAAATLAIYIPAQLSLEGNLTAWQPEVKFVLGLAVMAAISMPIGISAGNSWMFFSEVFIKAVVMFIVITNVVRTELRLKGLIWLALGVGVMVSFNAMSDYASGNFKNDGYRVDGTGHGMFGNPNDMALHLVIMTPLAVALLLGSRAYSKKILYGLGALLFVAGNMITFSRAGFLGLIVAMAVLVWKVGYGKRLGVSLLATLFLAAFLALAPGNYGLRIASIFVPSLDPVGSSTVREGHLVQSILVTLRHPLTGIGMGNFGLVSNHGQVTHNAYTQVSSEMGLIALAFYLAFMIYPFWQLFKIEKETRGNREARKYYYLAIGLQAGIAGYMTTSFFASVAYQWYIYYLVGYALCLRRIYRAQAGPAPEPVAEVKAPDLIAPPGAVPRIAS
jgi:O-antigen ligase